MNTDIYDIRKQEVKCADEKTRNEVTKLVFRGFYYYIAEKTLLFLTIIGITAAIINIRSFLAIFSASVGIVIAALLIYNLIYTALRKNILKTAKHIAETIPHTTSPFRPHCKPHELCFYEGLELLNGFKGTLDISQKKQELIGMLNTIGHNALYDARTENDHE